MTDTQKPLSVIGFIVIGLIIATIVVMAVRPIETLDPQTPEGVVQQYVQAVLDDDEASIEILVTDRFEAECDSHRAYLGDVRVSISESSDLTNGHLVEVEIEHDQGLGGSYTEISDVRLIQVNEIWLIDGAEWPLGCDF